MACELPTKVWRYLLLVFLVFGADLRPSMASGVLSDLEAGIGVDFAADLSNPGLALAESKMGGGLYVRGPFRWRLGNHIALRADPFVGFLGGHDRVEWTEYDGALRYYSDGHWTRMTQLGLMAGPQLDGPSEWSAVPYLGSAFGLSWTRHWHSFGGPSGVLLNPKDSGVERGGYVDPYTDQWVPMVGATLGLRLPTFAPFAMEVEAGYNVAFMSSAPLKKARPGMNAVRTAYGLNVLRIGINGVFTMSQGTKP
jgi:hypothetical protein